MSFVRHSFALFNIIRNARGILSAYEEIAFREHWQRTGNLRRGLNNAFRPVKPFNIDDEVLKVTGDYHISGFIVAVFFTKWMRHLRYVVEHRAEGGGSFCHIYSHTNLSLIKAAAAENDNEAGDNTDFGFDLSSN